MTTTLYETLVTVHSAEAFAAGWQHGTEDARADKAPLFSYPTDLRLYARYEYVSAYVDAYEQVKGL